MWRTHARWFLLDGQRYLAFFLRRDVPDSRASHRIGSWHPDWLCNLWWCGSGATALSGEHLTGWVGPASFVAVVGLLVALVASRVRETAHLPLAEIDR